jgi:tol-pal system protein YbgF
VNRGPHLRRFIAASLAAVWIGGAYAADPPPDRRAVRPGAPPTGAPVAPQSQGLIELLNELEALQAQLRDLRGQLEVQAHQLEQMKNRQLQSMVDFDRRLRELERRGTGQTSEGGTGGPPVTVVTPPVGGSAAASRAAPTTSEQQQYDAAFALMKQGLYEQAAKSFRELIARNPRGALADNAQYWIGEAAYVGRDFRAALDEFGKVVNNYPQSPKVPDALLKIGYTQYELSAYPKARETLSQIVTRYPNTAVARSAEQRLEKMSKEGR